MADIKGMEVGYLGAILRRVAAICRTSAIRLQATPSLSDVKSYQLYLNLERILYCSPL